MRHAKVFALLVALAAPAFARAADPATEAQVAVALAMAVQARETPKLIPPDPVPAPKPAAPEPASEDAAMGRAIRENKPLFLGVRYHNRGIAQTLEQDGAIVCHTDISFRGIEGPAVVVYTPPRSGEAKGWTYRRAVVAADDCSVSALKQAAGLEHVSTSSGTWKGARGTTPSSAAASWGPSSGGTPQAQPLFQAPRMFSGAPMRAPVRRGG